MIRAFVDYALNNRFIVVVIAVLLLVWGAIAFHNLPVEAYPDVANNYVQVITQWPGHAAEEIEQTDGLSSGVMAGRVGSAISRLHRARRSALVAGE